MKVCKYCSKEKPFRDFPKDNRSKCKACCEIYNAEWRKQNAEKVKVQARERARKYRANPDYRERERLKHLKYNEKNREKNLEYALNRQADRQEFLNNIKNVPCMDCGNEFPPCCMDFDHVRGEKLGNISVMKSYSIEKILEEVSRCEIVCSNCHRIRTFNRNNGQPEPLIR